ncbi:winged helix-turn-helix transcriptional regulator [Streptomyces sp. TRM S81-3]|uniref:Winged helix-turn-helix transcriptional regulator n=1 Tax=Streptomyces griseicoloratus TaxID=2752516 RepID=A0A926QUC6_9ACTN|nr:winged helix-turn-helix domain-containing protein [Streptomyces griseicoloratus]MBD0425004.1 winged helix-turn-helix transcriptional regulator [Streptomyces griseicoloratus]
MTAKGSGGGGEFRRVAEALRLRLADGTYPLGAFLPSQQELAQEFGASRETLQHVIRELGNEGWIDNRRGSRARVVKCGRVQSSTPKATRSRRPLTLGPLISEAFEQPEITLDVYTLTSESLDAHIRLQAERIRTGSIAPRRIALRMLLPSESLPLPYPRAKHDRDNGRLRHRLRHITRRHSESLCEALRELEREQLVPSVELKIRHAPLTPAFKLYVINGVEALHGPYEVIERTIVLDGGETIDAYDVLGLGARLTHHVKDADPNSPGSAFVESMQAWFDSVWDLLAEE